MSLTAEALYQAIISRIESKCNDEFCEDLSMRSGTDAMMDPDLKECIERLVDIYTIAHAFNKEHTCYHVHDVWRKPILDLLPTTEDDTLSNQTETTHGH